ncbi:MAG: 4'-phosphopantetheinyl transferase superfamily protein [Alistipes sp.]|nr:4'-phosphopantetheinyl transferase superfamily protein [Alistipes sp.]
MCDARLILEPVPADGELRNLIVTDGERLRAGGFAPRRRNEYLMWRTVVRRELGADVEIGYDSAGAPVLENRNEHIGVSHSADYVAVVISPRRCAVDVESLSRDFAKVASRYMTPAEAALSDNAALPAAVWCAKECLYKYGGRRGLDFLRDICVEKVDFGSGTVVGRICNDDSVEMRMSVHEGSLVVWVG